MWQVNWLATVGYDYTVRVNSQFINPLYALLLLVVTPSSQLLSRSSKIDILRKYWAPHENEYHR